MDNYLLHLLAVQLICDGQWWLAESSEWWNSTEMWKKPPKSSKTEKLIFILRSTSDDWPSDPSNKSQLKCKKGPLSHQKIKCLFLDYLQLLVIGQAMQAMKVNQNMTKGPLSHQKMKYSFLYYIQLLMIGQAIRVMKVDQNAKKSNVVSVRVFCCLSLGVLLFQSGSSVVSVWVFCCLS